MQFEAFPKIPRYSRGIVITEKLDGTNAQICIEKVTSSFKDEPEETLIIRVGSRNKWITPEDDNYGFAKWVERNKGELMALGEGRHFGEWYGNGIQRGYGLSEKRFALFNAGRWNSNNPPPACCSIVPVIHHGMFTDTVINEAMEMLKANGSYAVPGFMDPEGIVIYHKASNSLFKKTVKGDESPKGSLEVA